MSSSRKKLMEKAKQLNIPGRCKMNAAELEQAIEKTIKIYKEMIFDSEILCKACLDELRKQKKIDNYMYNKCLMKAMLRELSLDFICKDDMKIDKTTGEVVGPVIENNYYPVKF